ncbi:DUF6884 domain-containing protein [Bradyrhizobium sp. 2S1]|uniref:DUF6884 domain-containing protein n=1 Tax=Bradyrhizobium sp. 2S1 TaxID=1404429 RepID=UPI0039C880B8
MPGTSTSSHGSSWPDAAPYERTLSRMTVMDRGTWANVVTRQLAERGVGGGTAVVLAGTVYRAPLLDTLPPGSCSSRSP